VEPTVRAIDISTVFVPGELDVEAAHRTVDSMDALEITHRGVVRILGWGWSMDLTEARPWEDDPQVEALANALEYRDDVADIFAAAPPYLQDRYHQAERASAHRWIENVVALLSGVDPTFERLATRIPLRPAGYLLLSPENAEGGDVDSDYADIIRGAYAAFPDAARALGVYGLDDVEVHVAEWQG
jgi:hypothetical protein